MNPKASKLFTAAFFSFIGLMLIGAFTTAFNISTVEFPAVVETTSFEEKEPLKTAEPPKLSEPDNSGFRIIIKSLGIDQKMIHTSVQGREIIVPDSGIAYIQLNPGNTFIMAHKEGDFANLYKTPKYIVLSENGVAKQHRLLKVATQKVEDISMDSVLSHQGVVLMTCAGKKVNGQYTKRLILYYN